MDSRLVNYMNQHDNNVSPTQIDDVLLDEFRNNVKLWMQLDNDIKKLQNAVKDRKRLQKELTDKMEEFMRRYNIEDLNTSQGTIRFKTTYVKAPSNQKMMKEKIKDYFRGNEDQAQEFIKYLFEDREKVEKSSIRRVRS